jgi:uncharacterized protein YbaP (TraB family)
MRAFAKLLIGLLACAAWWMAGAHAKEAVPYTKGLLWKIERKGLHPSYLFGTVHSDDERILALPAEVRTAFDGASVYVMEVVMDERAIRVMAERMMFTDGRNLQQVLGGLLYARSVSAMLAYGIPEVATQQMKPWAVAMTLSMPRPKTGAFLDLMLMQAARQQDKGVFGLETADEQLALFNDLSLQDQTIMLEDTLNFLPEIDGMFAKLYELYLARDLRGLAELSEALEQKGNPELGRRLMVKLVDERNRRMATRAEPYLEQGKAFIAVGSLHLPGSRGLLNLLVKKGYRVSAVY